MLSIKVSSVSSLARVSCRPAIRAVRPGFHAVAPFARAQVGSPEPTSSSAGFLEDAANRFTEAAKANLRSAQSALQRVGFINFWLQLVLSVVSGVVLLFSVAFTPQDKNSVTLYMTVFGVLCGLVSTFWAYGYTRLAKSIRRYTEFREGKRPGEKVKEVRKSDVIATVRRGVMINIFGMGSTLLGLQATVGLLVAKTLTNATANPFLAGGGGSWNPVLALDVFLVQASTNTLMSHAVSLILNLWLLSVIAQGAGIPERKGQPADAAYSPIQ